MLIGQGGFLYLLKSDVAAIHVQDSGQGQVESSLHFLDICAALDVPQVLEKVGYNKKRATLEAACELSLDQAYTLCCAIHADSKRVVCAFYSENVLLNAYRQDYLGMPSVLCIDASYRLVIEGHMRFYFGTQGVDHKFHTIFIHICSVEDTSAHRSIHDSSVKEVEFLVADRSARGIGF